MQWKNLRVKGAQQDDEVGMMALGKKPQDGMHRANQSVTIRPTM
jgi:hypothetical protein